MLRRSFILALVAPIYLVGLAQAGFGPATWDGGDGMWFNIDPDATDGNWNGGKNVKDPDVLGRENGHYGYGETNGGADILINDGKVSFDAPVLGEDFRLKQGDTMTITGGAVWEMETLSEDVLGDPVLGDRFEFEETRWVLMDMTALNLDGGTFRRTGAVPEDTNPNDWGGGVVMFGSWKANDNFGDLDGDLDTDGNDFLKWQTDSVGASTLRKVLGTLGDNPNTGAISVNITNGGSLENEGQIWLGSDQNFQLDIRVHIDDGSITATGGVVPLEDFVDNPGIFEASIILFKSIGPDGAYETDTIINFTGPGSITTDEAAIKQISAEFDANGNMIDSTVAVEDMTYEKLWDTGILQANGGNDGVFGDHFSVTGNWGDASYVLTSLVPAAAISAVPEPTSVLLFGIAALALALANRRRTFCPEI